MSGPDQRALPIAALHRTSGWANYAAALGLVVLCTAIASLMFGRFERSNLIMVYLLGIIIVAVRFGRGPSVLASVLSVGAFDFFFAPPYYTFAVADTQYIFTFVVMLVVALTTSTLAVRLKQQAETARSRERRTATLYALSRELASTRGMDSLLAVAARHLQEVTDGRVAILMPDSTARLTVRAGDAGTFVVDRNELGVAQWVLDHNQSAGLGTMTLPGAQGLYLPLSASERAVAVLGVQPKDVHRSFPPEQLHLLETFASQTALAMERARLSAEAQQAQVAVETERLRNALLSSVSHDLRTPLATITGATSSLLTDEGQYDAQTRHELLQTVYEEGDRLNRLVGNLLDMTRLESGAVQVNKAWSPLEEVVGAALTRLGAKLDNHPLTINLPPDLPLVPLDDVLIEQVWINVLENALKYTPPQTSIMIRAWVSGGQVISEVADQGPGLVPGHEERIFGKFVRQAEATTGGAGLGLTICRGIVNAHGGHMWAEHDVGGGAVFRWSLPLDGTPPTVVTEAGTAGVSL